MIELQVEKMTCGGCAVRVTRAIQALDDEAKVKVDLPGKIVHVESEIDSVSLAQAVTAAGYPARART
jgi:copper chaperone